MHRCVQRQHLATFLFGISVNLFKMELNPWPLLDFLIPDLQLLKVVSFAVEETQETKNCGIAGFAAFIEKMAMFTPVFCFYTYHLIIMTLFRRQVIFSLLIVDTIFTTLRWTETFHMTDKYTHKHSSLRGPTV